MNIPVFKVLFVLVLNLLIIHCYEILFQDYCIKGSNPDTLPSRGSMSSGNIRMSESPENGTWYKPSLNCSVTIFTEKDYLLLLTFSNVSLRNSSMDNLTVIYNSDTSALPLSGQQVCSNENCKGLKFDSGKFNNLTLIFLSSNATVPSDVTGFQAHYTVYDLVGANGACRNKKQFLCENGHCIWNQFVCDGHNNCGDRSDETKCIIPVPDTIWGIVVIVVAILSIIIFVPLFCCLATVGTRSIVRSVTLSNTATPLIAATDCGETSGLLTSSDVISNCWPGSSYERSNSFSYGTSVEEATSDSSKKHRSMSEACEREGGAKYL